MKKIFAILLVVIFLPVPAWAASYLSTQITIPVASFVIEGPPNLPEADPPAVAKVAPVTEESATVDPAVISPQDPPGEDIKEDMAEPDVIVVEELAELEQVNDDDAEVEGKRSESEASTGMTDSENTQ